VDADASAAKGRLRAYYDVHAVHYDRWMRSYDRHMLGDARRRLCGLAVGRTLELGVGSGLNLPSYPHGVELTGVDFSSRMLALAQKRRAETSARMQLVLGDGHALPFQAGLFDTVVATLFLSSVPSPRVATEEMRRVLRPGGQLLLLDHVRSSVFPVRCLERVAAPFVQSRTGVDLRRDPVDYLADLGFSVDHIQRTKLGVIEAVVATRR
jgi:ubiquinone/menaquinone biosynthesis C-methylase UbiE